MATPVQIRKESSNNKELSASFTLCYPGRESKKNILAISPGRYEMSSLHNKGDNRLYHADNLGVLAALSRDKEVKSKVKLVYIDPPFGTSGAFESREKEYAYDDYLLGAEFVESIRKRLIFIHHILADDGALYLHLDGRMVFHLKLILDEIFGANNLRNFITRRKSNPKNYTRKTYGNISDYLLFYTKSSTYTWNRPTTPWDEETARKEYPYKDEQGRRFKKVPIHAPGVRNGETGGPWRDKLPPPGKHWQYRPSTLDEMDLKGEIYWSPNGNPRRKVFLDKGQGIPVQDIWMDMRDALNQNAQITDYPTEKNPALLGRIIEASSNEGDLVLDCYSGSGTTLEQASLLNRRWIGVDWGDHAIETTLRRFRQGAHKMGDYVTTNRQLSFPQRPAIEDFTLYYQADRGESPN